MNHRSPLSLAGKPAEAVNVVVQHVSAPDELRPVTVIATEWGIEADGLLRAAKRAGITVKVGRQTCARRSDLLRLPELLAKPAPAPSSTDPRVAYAELVGRKAGAR